MSTVKRLWHGEQYRSTLASVHLVTTVVRYLGLLLAAVRVARLTTKDEWGEWVYVGRIKRWATWAEAPFKKRDNYADGTSERIVAKDAAGPWINIDNGEMGSALTPPPEWGWRSKLVKGLDCGFCLTPWLVGGLLIATALTRPGRPLALLRPFFDWLVSTLALSYVAGHVWNKLDNN